MKIKLWYQAEKLTDLELHTVFIVYFALFHMTKSQQNVKVFERVALKNNVKSFREDT